MEELASALPISGAPYTYLLNVSTKSLSTIGAALLLLDFTSTSVVSASTAASYLSGEVTLPFPGFVGAIFMFLILGAMGLSGVKESARIALGVLTFHVSSLIPQFVLELIWDGLDADHVSIGNSLCNCMGSSRQLIIVRELDSRTSFLWEGNSPPDIQRNMYWNFRSYWL